MKRVLQIPLNDFCMHKINGYSSVPSPVVFSRSVFEREYDVNISLEEHKVLVAAAVAAYNLQLTATNFFFLCSIQI